MTVNGVSGNFILDTGASYVSVTAPFSAKAKINTNTAAQLPIKTVGGTVQAELGSAATVAVGGAEARNVVVAVIRGAHDPFGARIDGLLGMSFLARFNVHLLPNRIELTAAEFR